LKREFREIYEADGIQYGDAVEQLHVPPSHLVEPPTEHQNDIEQPNAVPDTIVELTETEKPKCGGAMSVEIRLPSTVVKEPSTIVDQPIAKLLPTGFSRAQSESELIDEEEACAVDDDGATYAFPALRVLPTDRPPPETGQDLIHEEEHGYAIEEPMGGDALPAPQLVPPDRPPPKPGEAAKPLAILEPTDRPQRSSLRRVEVKRQDRKKGGEAIRRGSRWYWRGRQSYKEGHVTVWDTAVRITEHVVVVRMVKPHLYYLRETLHV
jgi:hypothetical protein